MTSKRCGGSQRRKSRVRNFAPLILFSRALAFACATARGSLSSPRTSLAPKRRAASARIPVPLPASSRRQPGASLRVVASSKRKHIAVVACSPVPNAPAAGITSCGFSPGSPSVTTTSRRPMRSGARTAACRYSFCQSRASCSAAPPRRRVKSVASAFVRQVTCTRRRARPGRSITATLPGDASSSVISCAASHAADASYFQRYIRCRCR